MTLMPGPIRAAIATALAFASLGAAAQAPEAIVQQQLDAYNAHDLPAFMATYDANAEIYEFPAKLLMRGAAQIAEFYGTKRFTDARLHADLARRIVMGDKVVDHERVTLTYPEGPGHTEAVVIYEISGGKITKATIIRGTKTVDK